VFYSTYSVVFEENIAPLVLDIEEEAEHEKCQNKKNFRYKRPVPSLLITKYSVSFGTVFYSTYRVVFEENIAPLVLDIKEEAEH
jgi:hypothetical protein